MALWLFKEEPTHYNYADLERDRQTVWDGVENALALIHLRKVQPGDRVLYYHTGKEKAIVGEMRVVKAKDGEVTVAPVRRLPKPVPLAEIKKITALKDWDLVRNSRLSVMPVTAEQWRMVEEMAGE
ncbi:MAG TPA: EVE domain-containing protein [Gemmataceae bacterium]|nr:EVE domain-containing protein [Gemmataceae bacterium]